MSSISSRYFLRTSRDEAAQAPGQRGVGMIMFDKVETAFLHWIPVDGRLCPIKLLESLGIRREGSVNRGLFVCSAYDPTD